MPVPDSAKQTGQSRLQPVLTSMIPRHVCWACSGQIGIAVDDGLEPPWSGLTARPSEDHATALDDELGVENRPERGQIDCVRASTRPSRAFPAMAAIPGSTPEGLPPECSNERRKDA